MCIRDRSRGRPAASFASSFAGYCIRSFAHLVDLFRHSMLSLLVAAGALVASPMRLVSPATSPAVAARTPAAPLMGVTVKTTKPGDGKTYPKAGPMVKAHYTGRLMDGTGEPACPQHAPSTRPAASALLLAAGTTRGCAGPSCTAPQPHPNAIRLQSSTPRAASSSSRSSSRSVPETSSGDGTRRAHAPHILCRHRSRALLCQHGHHPNSCALTPTGPRRRAC